MSAAKAGSTLTLEALEAFIRAPAPEDDGSIAKPSPPASTALLDAAAVLVEFDPFVLNPFGSLPGGRRDAALERLIDASEPVPSARSERSAWTLKLLERHAALRRLATRDAMRRALAVNPVAKPSRQQRMLESLIEGAVPPLATATREEIAALITAHEWLSGIIDGLPPLSSLHEALARADVFAPLHRLVANGFFGRVAERQRINAYLRESVDFSPPLFLHGPGGVGKSTLLARSILDQDAVVCAYVDIDRPSVRPEMPPTFLLEILRQLRTQLASFESTRLETTISDDLSKGEAGRFLESAASFQGWEHYVSEFGRLVAEAAAGRVVVAIDTFEEAQFLGDDVVEPALDFLFHLSATVAALRIVISGRSLPRSYLVRVSGPDVVVSDAMTDEELVATLPAERRPIGLDDLSVDDAQELLQRAVSEIGVAPLTPQELQDVTGIVGRNPMSLRLAARILRDGGIARLRENAAELLRELRAEKIQAMLYGRILHHVHKKDVAKVAYPGLVVRRITPEIVRQVLARPCGLTLTAERDEFAIWHDLSEEIALVHLDKADNSLRHRVDVRRVMLQDLLDNVSPAIVAEIDEAAVDYYSRQPSDADRAEEIYHRLRCAEPAATLEERWRPASARFLQDALEDFSAATPRLWLANKLGVTLAGELRQQANLEEWEAQTTRAAERYLANGNAKSAISLITERTDRSPRSALYALEAETLRFLGRPDEALVVARTGVEALSRAGATGPVAELLLKMAAIEEGRQDFQAAKALLDEVMPLAERGNDPLLQLRVFTTWIRVDRHLRPDSHDARNLLRHRAAALLDDEVLHRLRQQPVLLRELAAELANVDARLAGQAIQTLGLEVTTDSQVKSFAEALAKLSGDPSSELRPDVRVVAESASKPDLSLEELRKSVEGLSAESLRQVTSKVFSSDNATLKGFREYFRASVDNILKTTRF